MFLACLLLLHNFLGWLSGQKQQLISQLCQKSPAEGKGLQEGFYILAPSCKASNCVLKSRVSKPHLWLDPTFYNVLQVGRTFKNLF